MKKISLKLVVLTLALLMPVLAFAKTKDLGGKVVDAQGNPLPYVNVVLLSLPDSTFVQGAVTDIEGSYKITTVQNKGVLKISCVGYITQCVNAADGLTIRLEEDTQLLGEVVVKGTLPQTKLTGDGLQTSIRIKPPTEQRDSECGSHHQSRCSVRCHRTQRGTHPHHQKTGGRLQLQPQCLGCPVPALE